MGEAATDVTATDVTAIDVHVRALRDDDFEAVAAIATANFPDEPRTGVELREKYAEYDERRFAREWVVAEAPSGSSGGIVGYAFWGHVTWAFHPDKYVVYVAVDPARQRQGIGTRLMRHLLDRLRERGAKRLKTWAREDYAHSLQFLAGHGFAEFDRAFESRLPVAHIDLARFAEAEARAQSTGVVITTLAAELARDPGCLPAVYQAHTTMDFGAPRDDADLPTPPAYEHWLATEVRHPRVLLDAYFLAKAGDLYVGESVLKRSHEGAAGSEADVLRQQLTGVLPEYRGHGIATALKLRTVAYAQQHGYREIHTFNDSRNGPMLAVNGKLGFIRQPAWVRLRRELPTGDSTPG